MVIDEEGRSDDGELVCGRDEIDLRLIGEWLFIGLGVVLESTEQ